MALRRQPTNGTYDSYEDMIASHHYFIPTENKIQAEYNFVGRLF